MPLPIFGKATKNPADIVRSLKEALVILETKNASIQSEGAGNTSIVIFASIKIYSILDRYHV